MNTSNNLIRTLEKKIEYLHKKYSPLLRRRHETLLLELEPSERWEFVKKSSNVTLYKMQLEESNFLMFKTITYFDGVTPQKLFDLLFGKGERALQDRFLPVVRDLKYIHVFDEGFKELLIYQIHTYGSMWFSDRDYVLFQTQNFNEETGMITMFGETLDDEDSEIVCPKKEKLVRGSSYFGQVFRKKGTGTEVVYLSQCDPKGYFPSRFFNGGAQQHAWDMTKKMVIQVEKDGLGGEV